jgi:hypothetical protein
VNSSVHLDVHIVADLEGAQVRGQGDVPFMPEGPGEQVPGAGSQTMAGRHCGCCVVRSLHTTSFGERERKASSFALLP